MAALILGDLFATLAAPSLAPLPQVFGRFGVLLCLVGAFAVSWLVGRVAASSRQAIGAGLLSLILGVLVALSVFWLPSLLGVSSDGQLAVLSALQRSAGAVAVSLPVALVGSVLGQLARP